MELRGKGYGKRKVKVDKICMFVEKIVKEDFFLGDKWEFLLKLKFEKKIKKL